MNSQFFQNILFNIEKNFLNLKNIDKTNKHVFIFGLARSGTTILLNSLYSTNEYASTLYKDMPFVLSPSRFSTQTGPPAAKRAEALPLSWFVDTLHSSMHTHRTNLHITT